MAHEVLLTFVILICGFNLIYSFKLDINKGKGKVSKGCRGDSLGLAASGTIQSRYENYKRIYTNCTYVDGNLEIKYIEWANITDFSFLESIEEVNGYVLIVGVYADYVPLTNLRIIRGRELLSIPKDDKKYSLNVMLNTEPGSRTVGLKELRFKHLTEISRGNVKFYHNKLLCHHDSINWTDIVAKDAEVFFEDNSTVKCGKCSPGCYNNITGKHHCWGSGKEWCQKLTQVVCHKGCDSRCFGTDSRDCCHNQCAAGCTGPQSSDCVKCKDFYNEGTCVSDCPPIVKYDSHTLKAYSNPEGRYKYKTFCVKSCPEHLLIDTKLEACMKSCRTGYYPINGTCEVCDGPCPKYCIFKERLLRSTNIHLIENCTVIEGSIRMLPPTFKGDNHRSIPGINISDLDVFKTVKEITGFLMVQSDEEDLVNMSFLSNLTTIHGRELDTVGNSLSVVNTKINSLDLISLKKIKNGKVVILNNQNLCFTTSKMFLKLSSNFKQKVIWGYNKDPSKCLADGEICDKSCSDDGCWGKGPTKCLSCRTYRIDNSSNICIDSCNKVPRMYDNGNGLCKFCDQECESSCVGYGPEKCHRCKNFELRGEVNGTNVTRCLNKCPEKFYADENNICHPCHEYCEIGCTGPSSEVKIGGCKSCMLGIELLDNQGILQTWCTHPDTEKCPHGHFQITKKHLQPGVQGRMRVCVQCHSFCDGCFEAGATNCIKCKKFQQYGVCVDKCVSLSFPDENGTCQSCDKQCSGGCNGLTSADCHTCLNRKIYLEDEFVPKDCENSTSPCKPRFNCTKECPPELPYRVQDPEDEGSTNVCVNGNHPEVLFQKKSNEEAEKRKILIIVGCSAGGAILLGVILLIFGYFWKQRAKSQEKTAILTAKMTGYGEDEPVTPTDAKPDMSCLRLIKESELRKGGIIGSGAFGTVYKGFWIPSNEHVKIPVAIKVLQEGTSPNQNKELLEEARVMASVDHPCCIRILAVCMTAQMMLITQLMPLGCLLDYVRKHKDNIGSKVLLNWCTQIAKGMSYLEERGIVHRDLAARNVLVQSPGQIKITDFGLAKLLDYNEDEYHASGGKMPIKWLALECIQHRIFTHKSDVWSYGVTVWELLTYGQRPYESVRARDVPDLLEKGERLSQPPACTIDVYMIMIKCWMLDADSRPTFTELAEEFAKMSRDPGRYLVIAGDVLKKIPDESDTPSRIELITPEITEAPTMQLEGDKLMRLPSHSYDKNDLARSLSVAAECPEEVMEAEEYLQPTPRHSMEHPTTPLSSKTPLLQHYGEASNARELKEGIRSQPRREKRYGHLESAAAARQQRLDPGRLRGDSVNSRYSSDPVKVLHIEDELDGTQRPPLKNGVSRPTKIALDEDNYLQPNSSKPRAYTDIIDVPDYMNDSSVFEENPQQQYVRHEPALNFQNPEYFEDVPASRTNVPKKPYMNNNRNKDYYNEVSTKKSIELKPLMISEDNSETTV